MNTLMYFHSINVFFKILIHFVISLMTSQNFLTFAIENYKLLGTNVSW